MRYVTGQATRRITATIAGALLAGGVLTGLTACNGGAQTGPYDESPSPSPTPSSTSLPSTPVPTTVDESGTLGG